MKILAIDTSSNYCSVAVYVGDEVYNKTLHIPRQHNVNLLPMIASILEEAQVKKSELQLLAYGVGPGSFVGVRLGASAMQGISAALNIPVIGISSMQIAAQSLFKTQNIQKVNIILDARMSDLYVGSYAVQDDIMLSNTEVCIKANALDKWLKDYPCEHLIGDEIANFNKVIDTQSYCPDMRFALPLIEHAVKHAEQNHRLDITHNAMPVYLQGTGQWKKLS